MTATMEDFVKVVELLRTREDFLNKDEDENVKENTTIGLLLLRTLSVSRNRIFYIMISWVTGLQLLELTDRKSYAIQRRTPHLYGMLQFIGIRCLSCEEGLFIARVLILFRTTEYPLNLDSDLVLRSALEFARRPEMSKLHKYLKENNI